MPAKRKTRNEDVEEQQPTPVLEDMTPLSPGLAQGVMESLAAHDDDAVGIEIEVQDPVVKKRIRTEMESDGDYLLYDMPETPSPEWNAMFFQLAHYKAVKGDMRVRTKDESTKTLNDWMVAQRKEFKVYQESPEKSSLTQAQVRALDLLQFPWNTRGEEHWFRNYDHLKQFRLEHGHCMVPRTYYDVPNLCHWVTDQRRQLKNMRQGKPSTMTKERQKMLDDVGFVWAVRNRTTWDTRFEELVKFKEERGNTTVPQHYAPNKALGKWVAKQREQYKLLKKGEHSFMTPDRLDQLESIGFVWSMKGRTAKDDEDDDIEDAAVAAAKAAVAAAVAAEDADAKEEDDMAMEETHVTVEEVRL